MAALIIRSTLPADLEVSLEPLLPLSKSSKLNGMIFVLDKSRTGSCKSLTKEQLSTFIAHHGGAVVAMFAPEVTHAFSETDRAPLAKSAAMAGIPCLDSCQLAGLIDPDYLQREVSRHEDEAREARAKEQEAEEAMKKMQQEQQQQAPATRKKPRIKRTYSAPVEDIEEKKNKEETGAASHSMSNLPTVKMEEEEEEVGSTSSGAKRKRDEAREGGDGMVVAAVKKVARVAKRRKKLETQTTSKPAPEDNETIMKEKKKSVEAKKVEVEGENGDSSNGSGEVPATPLHERRRRFEGKVFFLLGRFMRKQAEMQAFIEENGGEVAKSITRKVTHLLTAQGDDGTLAFKQARQRSLKIITEERLNEFMAAARSARAQAVMSSSMSGEQQQGRLLQVPTTPVASSAQRREQAQRVALTPLPSSAQTQPAELLFDASPSWKVIRHKMKKSKNEKQSKKEKKEKKEAKKKKKKSSSCREEDDKENSSPVRSRLDSSP